MANKTSPEDREFVRTFEAFGIAPEDFSHRSHIQLAYVYLCKHDVETTCGKVRDALCSFLSHIGVEPSSKYHATITKGWVLAVHRFMSCQTDTASATEFIDANLQLLDTGLLGRHYSKEPLFSDAARKSFVEPDLAPFLRDDEAPTLCGPQT